MTEDGIKGHFLFLSPESFFCRPLRSAAFRAHLCGSSASHAVERLIGPISSAERDQMKKKTKTKTAARAV